MARWSFVLGSNDDDDDGWIVKIDPFYRNRNLFSTWQQSIINVSAAISHGFYGIVKDSEKTANCIRISINYMKQCVCESVSVSLVEDPL